MALIGEMQYLTIGGNTYSLPAGSGGTVTSVAVSNATNGGLSISGGPISSSGTITIGHSNVLTAAQTTQAVYPITIDKNGHISAYGTAVTIPSAVTNAYSSSPKTGDLMMYTNHNISSTVSSTSTSGALTFSSSAELQIGKAHSDDGSQGTIKLSNTANSNKAYTTIVPSGTESRTITLPNATGTVALISDIPTVPTKTSDLTNDSGFINSIKTINNQSLIGSGDIEITGGASAYIAEYGVTSYADVKTAYDDDAIILCAMTSTGETALFQMVDFDITNQIFYFSMPYRDGTYWSSISNANGWDNGVFEYASTDVATTTSRGLMSQTDKVKLNGIASGAEVNVQSNWSQSDSTADDYIKNKPDVTMWGGVTLDKSTVYGTDFYVPNFSSTSANSVQLTYVTTTPSAGKIPRYDGNDYLISTTPSANDNSTKVATTAYVKSSIPTKVSDLTNDSGFITGVTSTSTPTASTISEFDSTAHMNSTDMTSAEVSSFVGNLGYTFNLIDMFYPVGSYYETSDTTFNPNITWGGTWVLETEGQVHVSAGENYEVGDTGGEATHTLTVTEMPVHGHNTTTWVLAGTSATSVNWKDYGATLQTAPVGNQLANGTWKSSPFNSAQSGRGDPTGIAEASGNGQAHNNMQPYIVVNRWHRTA